MAQRDSRIYEELLALCRPFRCVLTTGCLTLPCARFQRLRLYPQSVAERLEPPVLLLQPDQHVLAAPQLVLAQQAVARPFEAPLLVLEPAHEAPERGEVAPDKGGLRGREGLGLLV